MTVPQPYSSDAINNAYGFPVPYTRLFPAPVLAGRIPNDSTDLKYPVGQIWVYPAGGVAYILVSNTGGTATWEEFASSSGDLFSLTGDSGGAITPVSGNISLLGTANEITTTGTTGTITWSIPTTFVAPGSIASTTGLTSGGNFSAIAGTSTFAGTFHVNVTGSAVTTIGTGGTGAVNIGNATGNTAITGSATASTTLTATLGNITATNGNVVFGTAGNKLISTSVASTTTAGANSFGTVTLVGGTATVDTSAVTSSSIIFLTRTSVGSTGNAALGILSVGTIVANTSFVINAWETTSATTLQSTDVSVIGWMIVN